jgi:hypothetical protein
VAVDDAPFVVHRLEVLSGPSEQEAVAIMLRIHLSDGSIESIRPGALWLDASGHPYCRVRGDAFRARLSVAAWLQLAPWLEESVGGSLAVVRGGRRGPLGRDA